jgi:hypothetical protein
MRTRKLVAVLLGVAALLGLGACATPRYPQPTPMPQPSPQPQPPPY